MILRNYTNGKEASSFLFTFSYGIWSSPSTIAWALMFLRSLCSCFFGFIIVPFTVLLAHRPVNRCKTTCQHERNKPIIQLHLSTRKRNKLIIQHHLSTREKQTNHTTPPVNTRETSQSYNTTCHHKRNKSIIQYHLSTWEKQTNHTTLVVSENQRSHIPWWSCSFCSVNLQWVVRYRGLWQSSRVSAGTDDFCGPPSSCLSFRPSTQKQEIRKSEHSCHK